MTRTLTLAAAALALAAPAFANPADILKRHAAADDDRQLVRFIEQGGFDGSYTTFGGGDRVAALQVALRHAEQNDEEQRAEHLRERIAAATAGDDVTAFGGTKDAGDVSALGVALRHAVETDEEQRARVLRSALDQ